MAVRITISTTFLDTDIEFFGAFNASSIHSFARRPDNSLKTKWSRVQNAKKKGGSGTNHAMLNAKHPKFRTDKEVDFMEIWPAGGPCLLRSYCVFTYASVIKVEVWESSWRGISF